MNLNRWIRLWLVACGLLLIVTIAVAFAINPRPSDIAHHPSFFDALSVSARSQLAPDDAQDTVHVKLPNGHIVTLQSGAELSKGNLLVTEYAALLERKVWQRRVQLFNGAGAAWFLACLLLLLVGLGISWGRRRKSIPIQE